MSGFQILLAEDNLADILLIQEALRKHQVPHELFIVHDGDEAFSFVARMGEPGEAPCPDVMLLDLNLPRVDGPEILSEFRKHPQCADTPVIVISSSDARRDRERMAALGISRYFRKPIDLEAFLRLGAMVWDVLREEPAKRSNP